MKKILSFLYLMMLTMTLTWAGEVATFNLGTTNGVSTPEGFFKSVGEKWNWNSKFKDGEYDGISFSNGLKMESTTRIGFTTAFVSRVTIVQSTWSANTIKLDDIELAVASAVEGTGCRIYTVANVAAGDHVIGRGSGESGLFYVKVEWGTGVEDGGQPFGDEWTIAGSEAILGSSWDTNDTNNNMTSEDGITYTLVKENCTLEAGTTYIYKVVKNHDWANENYGANGVLGGENVQLTVDETGVYTVTFTFVNDDSHALSAVAVKSGEAGPITHTYAIVGELTGGWENDAQMTQSADDANVYTLTIEGFEAEAKTYSYKLRADGKWGGYELPASGNNSYKFDVAGIYTLVFAANISEHTLALEATKTGDVEEPTYIYAVVGGKKVAEGEEADAAIFSGNWDAAGTTDLMTLDEESGKYVWKKEAAKLDPQTIALKVIKKVEGAEEAVAWYPTNAVEIEIAEAGEYNVTVTFDPNAEDLWAQNTVTAVPEKVVEPIVINSLAVVGTFPGMSWEPTEGIPMTKTGDYNWTVTIENVQVEAIMYEYKVTANGVWGDYELPAVGNNICVLFGTAEYPAGKYNLTFTADTENHTLTLTADYPAPVEPIEVCPTPLFTRYNNTLSIECSEISATVYYTLDGSTPTTSSTLYTGPITLTENCTVKAIAVEDGYEDSAVATYVVDWFKVADVTFAQNGNQVTLCTETEDAIIHYTLSNEAGEQTCVSGTVLTMTGDCTIEAYATRDGYTPSDTTRFEFHADGVTCSNPVFEHVEGSNTITASTLTEQAVIHYTTDGSAPTVASDVFPTEGVTVDRNMTIKAIALRDNYYPSQVTTFEVDWFKVEPVEFAQEGNHVSLSTTTEQATIYYTLSNSEAGEQMYTDVLTMTGDCTIEAYATRDGYTPSDTTHFEFIAADVTVATPVLARVDDTNNITMSTTTEQATIHYTLDGTSPTADSPVYEKPITVDRNLTIKAIALRQNWFDSGVDSLVVNWFKVEPVEFVQEGNQVSLSTETEEATIHYTLSNNNEAGEQVYTDVLIMTGDCTIEAYATRDGYTPSDTTRFEFHADGVTCSNPVFEHVEGSNTITASTLTEQAVIHYTTDGSAPTVASDVFPTEGVTVDRNMTIKAIALRDNYYPSQVTTFEVDWFKVEPVEFAQEGNHVSLSTTTEQATIYYTLSNTEEDEQTYTAPLTMTTDCVIEAWATREGYNDSDTTRYEFRYIPQGEVTFDGLVATVSGERTLDEAFEQVGGRAEAAKTIAAIIWNKDEALTQDDLQGIDNPNLLVYAADRALVPYTVNNVVAGGVARNLILTDNGTGNCNFYCPQSFTAQHATYSRDFTQRTQPGVSQGWEALALPFDVQEMRHATRGAILPFGATGNGRHFWLRRQTAEGGLAQATGIEANRAYLVSMPNSDSYDDSYNLAGRVTFSATDVTIPVTAEADSTGIGTRLTAAFQRIEPSPVVYAINRGEAYGGYAEGSVFVSGLREVRPFEAYTVHQDTTVPAPLYIPIDGESWLTDITQPSADMQPGTGQYYDLQGRRVAQPTKKGLYIVNGQKTVVR